MNRLHNNVNLFRFFQLKSAHFLKKTNNSQKLFSTSKLLSSSQEMDLKLVVKRLEQYASLKLACNWDNVGLLVEPTESLTVKRVFITNDLTEPVLDEAIAKKANLIISYHPAVFNPLKRLTQSEWKQRSIVKCIENKIAV
jgi:hypothetical protein